MDSKQEKQSQPTIKHYTIYYTFYSSGYPKNSDRVRIIIFMRPCNLFLKYFSSIQIQCLTHFTLLQLNLMILSFKMCWWSSTGNCIHWRTKRRLNPNSAMHYGIWLKILRYVKRKNYLVRTSAMVQQHTTVHKALTPKSKVAWAHTSNNFTDWAEWKVATSPLQSRLGPRRLLPK